VSRVRRLPPILSAIAIATIVFLYLPLAAVAAMSVNAARFGVAWKGFSLRWYSQLAHNDLVVHAAANTLILAVVSTAVSTVLGTLLAIGLERFPWPRWMRRLIDGVVYVPVVTPDIVFAVGMLLADPDPSLQDLEIRACLVERARHFHVPRRFVVFLEDEEAFGQPLHGLEVCGIEGESLLVLLDGELVVFRPLCGGARDVRGARVGGVQCRAAAEQQRDRRDDPDCR
jgi:hypothetical protein